ncbi:MAG: PilZ domain-containing protein [Candidatus Omnitrophota bacterium]
MEEKWDQEERRHYIRIEKNFIISYCDKNDRSQKHDVSQLKNISLGGMCFVAGHRYPPSTKLCIELKTPYLAGTAHIEGTVLESHEKITGMLFETRLTFDPLSPESEHVLNKIIETFSKLKDQIKKE